MIVDLFSSHFGFCTRSSYQPLWWLCKCAYKQNIFKERKSVSLNNTIWTLGFAHGFRAQEWKPNLLVYNRIQIRKAYDRIYNLFNWYFNTSIVLEFNFPCWIGSWDMHTGNGIYLGKLKLHPLCTYGVLSKSCWRIHSFLVLSQTEEYSLISKRLNLLP